MYYRRQKLLSAGVARAHKQNNFKRRFRMFNYLRRVSSGFIAFACVVGALAACSQDDSGKPSNIPEAEADTAAAPAQPVPDQRHALPPDNPFLIQNSVYPATHFDPAQTDTTRLPVWEGNVAAAVGVAWRFRQEQYSDSYTL
jgi:DMSO/TMAO reductase YedYZ molybdopterin-dependent catalytic subunit